MIERVNASSAPAATKGPAERRFELPEWRKRMAMLGRIDFDDAKVREREKGRLLPRTRSVLPPTREEQEASLAAPRKAGFEYFRKSLSGSDLSIVGRILQLAGGERLTRPYEQCGWVYACITALASAVASVKVEIWTRDPKLAPDTAERLPESHPLSKLLLVAPNDHQSADEFYRAGVTHRRLDGEDVWFMMDKYGDPIEPGAVPEMIVPWRGSIVDIMTDKNGFPRAYRWPWRNTASPGGQILDSGIEGPSAGNSVYHRWFPSHSVVHFRDYDPSNPARGIGAVEVLLSDLEQEYQAGRYQTALLSNAGDPGGWIITKRKMSRENQEVSQQKLDDETSNVRNRGRWKIVADEHAQIVPNQMSPKDLEFSSLLVWVRDKIASVMGVPPTIIGIYDRATFRNFETAMQQFWTGPNGVIAYLRSVEKALDFGFFRKLRGPEQEYRLRFDIESIQDLQEDLTDKIKQAIEASAGANELSLSAALQLFGIDLPEDVMLTDTVLVPMGTQTLEQALTAAEPDPEASDGSDSNADGNADDNAESGDSEDDSKSASPLVSQSSGETAASHRAARREAFHVELRGFRRSRSILLEKEWTRRVAAYLRSYRRSQIEKVRQLATSWQRALGDPDALQTKSEFTLSEVFEAIALDRNEWDAKFQMALGDIAERTFSAASESLAGVISEDASFILSTDSEAIAYARTQRAALVEGVNSRLSQEVTRIVQQSLEQGATSSELRVALSEVLPDLTDELRQSFARPEQRAQAIARTETGNAVNGGRIETMRQNGVTHHEWSSADDDAVRKTHQSVDGEVRRIGDTFSNGLWRPNQPGAPAEEVINCRCETIPADSDEI